MEEVQNYGKFVYIQCIFEMAGERMHTPYPTPGHKLQKPPKKSGIFQSLGSINFVIFY